MLIANVSHQGRSGVAISDDGVNFKCDLSAQAPSDDAVLTAVETRKVGPAAVNLKAAGAEIPAAAERAAKDHLRRA